MDERLDHEKLDVYSLLLRFIEWGNRLLEELPNEPRASIRHVRDHLDRASLSALFNTAEGNGKRQRRVRARFFDDARGSTAECAACLDALVAKGACSAERVAEGKQMLFRIISMLTRLVARYSGRTGVRESEGQYDLERAGLAGGNREDDDEDENEEEAC